MNPHASRTFADILLGAFVNIVIIPLIQCIDERWLQNELICVGNQSIVFCYKHAYLSSNPNGTYNENPLYCDVIVYVCGNIKYKNI